MSKSKRKKADVGVVKALNAYEKTKKYKVQLKYGPSGRVSTLTGLSQLVKDAFKNARNHQLPVQLFTKDSGVYPDKAAFLVICGTAFSLAVDPSADKNDKYRALRKRFNDALEVDFFQAVCFAVSVQTQRSPSSLTISNTDRHKADPSPLEVREHGP